MLKKFKEKGLKCNIDKPFFGKAKMKYLGFGVARDGVKHIN